MVSSRYELGDLGRFVRVPCRVAPNAEVPDEEKRYVGTSTREDRSPTGPLLISSAGKRRHQERNMDKKAKPPPDVKKGKWVKGTIKPTTKK